MGQVSVPGMGQPPGCVDHEDRSVAAAARVDLDRWRTEFYELTAPIAPRFAREEPRRHGRELAVVLMAELLRVNG
jgi:hypothetical protein